MMLQFRIAVLLALAVSLCPAGGLRVASFTADATPPLGEPLIWVTPATKIEDPLFTKGVVIEDGKTRYVLAAIDWCGIGGSFRDRFQRALAQAAATDIRNVTLHSVHQHSAPYIDGGAHALLAKLPDPPLLISEKALQLVADNVRSAVELAVKRLEPFDRIGTSEVRVERVASARRILVDGKVITRYSGGAKDPKMAAYPEGDIDPMLKTITFARGDKPLVRLHYYATHPQTFCCDGRVSGDIVGAARTSVEKGEGVAQVYFTGAAGDVTVGKYNDGSDEARRGLTQRLEKALRAAADSTRWTPVSKIAWRTAKLKLPPKPAEEYKTKKNEAAYRAAIGAGFALRKEPIEVAALEIGPVVIVHLPGEPMLHFQRYAQRLRPNNFVAVAGYGDITPGYLCTDLAQQQGGYEPSASYAAIGGQAELEKAIETLIGRKAR